MVGMVELKYPLAFYTHLNPLLIFGPWLVMVREGTFSYNKPSNARVRSLAKIKVNYCTYTFIFSARGVRGHAPPENFENLHDRRWILKASQVHRTLKNCWSFVT